MLPTDNVKYGGEGSRKDAYFCRRCLEGFYQQRQQAAGAKEKSNRCNARRGRRQKRHETMLELINSCYINMYNIYYFPVAVERLRNDILVKLYSRRNNAKEDINSRLGMLRLFIDNYENLTLHCTGVSSYLFSD